MSAGKLDERPATGLSTYSDRFTAGNIHLLETIYCVSLLSRTLTAKDAFLESSCPVMARFGIEGNASDSVCSRSLFGLGNFMTKGTLC